MDYKYIEQLLERYFEAQTTLKEEQILKAFFEQSDEELPASLLRYKELFAALSRQEVLGDDFDERMLRLTGQGEQVKARTIGIRHRLRPLFRAAAVVAIFLTLATALNQSFSDEDIWTDEEQFASYRDALRNAALAAAEDSLMLLSEGLSGRADSLSVAADSLLEASTGYLE